MTNHKREIAFLLIFGVIVAVIALLFTVAAIVESLDDLGDYEIMQLAQFHSIEVAIDMFVANSGYDDYPPSKGNSFPPPFSVIRTPYGGANKLAEALVGWDLLGYHPESDFRRDGQSADSSGETRVVYEVSEVNLKEREGPFIELEMANAFMLQDIYEPSVLKSGGVNPNNYVFCDVYARKRHSGKKTGMPILYYRADTSKSSHDVDDPDNPDNIYNYKDNHILLGLGVPGRPDADHPMFADCKLFYDMTRIATISTVSRPYRSNSFILISAGKDGLYGTDDDMRNFTKE